MIEANYVVYFHTAGINMLNQNLPEIVMEVIGRVNKRKGKTKILIVTDNLSGIRYKNLQIELYVISVLNIDLEISFHSVTTNVLSALNVAKEKELLLVSDNLHPFDVYRYWHNVKKVNIHNYKKNTYTPVS